jgi:hypothetical protein
LQIDDINGGIHPYPSGLFWTVRIPDPSVTANPNVGTASYSVRNLQIADYGSFDNSFSGATGVPARVSFEVHWSGGDRVNILDEDNAFAAHFFRGQAYMAWTAVVGDYKFHSDPIETSHSDFAEIGRLKNGVYFTG